MAKIVTGTWLSVILYIHCLYYGFSSNYFVIFQKERKVKQWKLGERTLKQRKSISPSWMPQDIRALYPI
jgi:hypothetical protein